MTYKSELQEAHTHIHSVLSKREKQTNKYIKSCFYHTLKRLLNGFFIEIINFPEKERIFDIKHLLGRLYMITSYIETSYGHQIDFTKEEAINYSKKYDWWKKQDYEENLKKEKRDKVLDDYLIRVAERAML